MAIVSLSLILSHCNKERGTPSDIEKVLPRAGSGGKEGLKKTEGRGGCPSSSLKGGGAVCYNNRQMTLKSFIQITAFILIIIGTAGLLLNEFVWEHSSTRTIIFAVVNFVGLVDLAFAHFGMRKG